MTAGDIVMMPVQFVRLQGQKNEDAQVTIVEANGKIRQARVLASNLRPHTPGPIAAAAREWAEARKSALLAESVITAAQYDRLARAEAALQKVALT